MYWEIAGWQIPQATKELFIMIKAIGKLGTDQNCYEDDF